MKSQQSLRVFIVLVIAVFAGPLMAQMLKVGNSDGKKIESPNLMPIVAWSGLPLHFSTPQRFKELKDAGFTHQLQTYPSMKDILKVLNLAEQAGIKMFVNIIPSMPLKEYIGQVKGHKALAGYYIGDEPNATRFDDLGKKVKAVQELDSEHICYINLLPTYGQKYLKAPTYEQYVAGFLEKVPVEVLTFDHYPIFSDHGVLKTRPDFYRNLEIIRNAALKTGKPFWAFALTTSHWGYPIPTMAHLRFQVYSNLAYGAVGIQYFTYWTIANRPGLPDFNNGPLDSKGRRTVVYDRVKKMNAEIQALAGVFLGSKVVSVAHTGKTIPKGTMRYRAKSPFRSLTATGTGAVVAELENGNRRFVVVVNRDIQNTMTLKVNLEKRAELFDVDKAGAAKPIDKKSAAYEVTPGDVKVFMWTVS